MTAAAWMKKTLRLTLAFAALFLFLSHWTMLAEKADALKRRIASIDLKTGSVPAPRLQGEAAYLLDERTGAMLYGKNIHERLYPASTTKILTALVAIEKGNPDDVVTVGDEVRLREPDESSAGLVEGEQIKLRDLLAALLLPSGNDAARTVARYIATIETGKNVSAEEGIRYFAGLMNEKARSLGATESHFVNPHGLQDPDHYTTARDLALIARAGRSNPMLRQIVAETAHTVRTPQVTQTYVNRNQLLNRSSEFYDKSASGMKTGFTNEAGYCLVASATRGGRSLIAVVLHSSENGVWNDAERLLEYGFAST
ncbi:D-alanyl-D-alanine carboxypeptidase family protein [Paenibacillus humicola]|uniref:D-alanyl-D-alanine carboxypeptidase family protein n=1 Tax=Paenibacillus humicola TaxID=3110540 RepID=UPI00237BC012|nr:D-alanyl-D-alanine carboxypeptidase family protein [Paenibacillus humicola]